MSAQEPLYVLGHSPAELQRLARQAAWFAPATRAVFERAGIGPGATVLDVGCGAGDVSLLLGELVGPDGAVIGVDRVEAAVAAARQRAEHAGLRQVTFRHAALDALDLAPVDAAVGRFVLMHQADPAALVSRAARLVRPGGAVAMIESHLDAFGHGWASSPASPAFAGAIDRIGRTIRAAGGRTDMGLRLRAAFLDAGLADPELAAHAVLAGADVPALCRYWGDSLRSMAEVADALGLEPLDSAAIEALEARMIAELDVRGAVMAAPLVVSAWSVVP